MKPDSPLRVAVDATPLLGHRTGVGVFTDHLLRRLARRDDVHPVAYAVTWRGRGGLVHLVPPGADVTDIPMPARPLRAAWRRLSWPPIERFVGAVDVVHGTNFVVPPARLAGRVVTVHDLTVLHFPELCTSDVRAYPGLLHAAIERGAWVHAVSAWVAGEVVEHFGAPPDRVVAVPHGVPEVPAADPDDGRRVAGGDRYVLALGTVEPRKDLPLLVRAFDRVASTDAAARLVIAGPDGWGAGALTTAIGAARHGDRVVRLGWVDEDRRAALLRGAAVLAYPSVYEGFGFPPLEAMTVGVPVVATTAGALPEVLGDAALLVAAGDELALAEALDAALNDGPTRTRLTAAGSERAAGYSWERCADGLARLYERASGGT